MPRPSVAALYEPTETGWRIWITEDPAAPRAAPASRIGVVAPLPPSTGHELNPEAERRPVADDPRRHRRPLYPPADRSLLWDEAELQRLERVSFRPLVLAYNAPRFVFDLHFAGGLLGHLRLGYVAGSGRSRWLDAFADLVVCYADGRMDYTIQDEAFPGVRIELSAVCLATAVGLVVRFEVTAPAAGSLVWCFGGASAFFTNYAFGAAAYEFEPDQCAGDRVRCDERGFTLRRAFVAGDSIMAQPCAVPRLLPGWSASLSGGSDAPGRTGYGPPAAAMAEPADLLAATDFATGATEERLGCLAVQEIPLAAGRSAGHLLLGTGRAMPAALAAPAAAHAAGLARNAAIAARVELRTPDAHLDAAARMLAFALEGTWGDTAFLHGAWSWRYAYLGWRGWYGPACYGWTERVARSIRAHLRLGQIGAGDDRGAVGHLLEFPPAVYYNMNEVFLDHVRHYFDYTGDVALLREVFPALERIVAWENRRLQPGNAYLYENSLNTWISDSHWYIRGQCTQASAYMLGAHRFLAAAAARLGEASAAYAAAADRIRAAMQRCLWLPRQGVFAEYRDTLGERLLHPQPELPTLYHAAEFGAATPLQISEMVHWADAHLQQETTPGGGRLYWSSNWHPNSGRSYTHSTYELAYAEELNFALTQYLAGRAEVGYELLRATLCGIFNGPTPGGLPCHAYVDGRQRANDEFADAMSMWARAVIEGLFGIAPRRADRCVRLSPQFPAAWPAARIRTPHFAYSWERQDGAERICWEAPEPTSVRLRLPVRAAAVHGVECEGRATAYRVTPGVGVSWVRVSTAPAARGSIQVRYTPAPVAMPPATVVAPDAEVRLDLAAYGARHYLNPQGVLGDIQLDGSVLRARATRTPGPGLVFLLAGTPPCPVWLPWRLEVVPPPSAPRIWRPPPAAGDRRRWVLIDLRGAFNAALTEVPARVLAAAQPPLPPASTVGFAYRQDHLGVRLQPGPSDAAWRAKVDATGVAWTADGLPFRTVKEGPNIAVVTRAGGFPAQLAIPVDRRGRELYLMVSGITFPVQSHVPNLRLVLRYGDGVDETVELANPEGIGDCWGTWLRHCHDTAANGFENLGGRFGPAGSCQVPDLTRPVEVDTEAHLLRLPLRAGVRLVSLEFAAVANDVIFGLMGASLLR